MGKADLNLYVGRNSPFSPKWNPRSFLKTNILSTNVYRVSQCNKSPWQRASFTSTARFLSKGVSIRRNVTIFSVTPWRFGDSYHGFYKNTNWLRHLFICLFIYTVTSRSLFDLLYNWPPSSKLLLNNSLPELIHFLNKVKSLWIFFS